MLLFEQFFHCMEVNIQSFDQEVCYTKPNRGSTSFYFMGLDKISPSAQF